MSSSPRDLLVDEETLRLAPEYRRCGLYVLVGTLVVASVGVGLQRAGLGLKPFDGVQVCVLAMLLLAEIAFCVFLFRWRLRVDGKGIWRRRLHRWECWSWEEFADGRIRRKSRGCYERATSPWWNRQLILEFMGKDHRNQLDRICCGLCRLLPKSIAPSTLPSEVSIRWDLPWHWLNLNAEGIVCRTPTAEPVVPWPAVQEVRIGRRDRQAERFTELEIQMPKRCVQIRGTCRGDELAERMLLHYVPSDRVLVYEVYGEPASVREAEFRIAKWKAKLKPTRVLHWINVLVMIPLCIAAALDKAAGLGGLWRLPGLALGWQILGSILFVLTFGVPPFLIWLMNAHFRRTCMKQITELQEWVRNRADLHDDKPSPGVHQSATPVPDAPPSSWPGRSPMQ
jgi:hypothetical protein